jgi:hypothetical protein
MGFSATWIAVKGLDQAEAFARLGVVDTGEQAEPDDMEFSYTVRPDGWLAVLIPRFDSASADLMERLSAGATAVDCSIEEHVMVSFAHGYEDGRLVWSVEHDPEDDLPLKIVGDPPAELAAISERLLAEQAEEDEPVDHVFSAPADLVYALCGYRCDGMAIPDGEPVMTLLTRMKIERPQAPVAVGAGSGTGGGLFGALAGLFKRR